MGENRTNYRRYEDRRVAVMVVVYEILFNNPPGEDRDEALLEALCDDFETDGGAILRCEPDNKEYYKVTSAFGEWTSNAGATFGGNIGLNRFKVLQDSAPGALTFTRVKRPTVFPAADWDNFWEDTLSGSTKAMLSVQLASKNEPFGFLWILQSNYSREWSSRDRALAEEVADVLARAIDRGI